MGNAPVRFPGLRIACAAGTLVLAGCVPNAYLYDDPPPAYYGGGYGYYPPPTGYYAHPGYYGSVHSPPRVVYVDHDHRGDDCRHGSHRDRRPQDGRGGHDDRRGHDGRDGHDRDQGPHDGRQDREPRGVRGMNPVADRAVPVATACSGRKCRSPGAPPVVKAPREPGRPAQRGPDSSPESQRDTD